MWFKQLTGIEELSPEHVKSKLAVDDEFIYRTNEPEKRWQHGDLEVISLKRLREQTSSLTLNSDSNISEVIADVQDLIADQSNNNAVFQVASQFNLLEMVGPEVSPEMGIERYEMDRTQGPACSIACGAGTIFRNYFIQIGDQIGQSRKNQINCFDTINKFFGSPFDYSNGYIDTTSDRMKVVNERINNLDAEEIEHLKSLLKVGIHWRTESTLSTTRHLVNEVFCSAVPVAYSVSVVSKNWEPIARIILEAAYEATLRAAMLNYQRTGVNKVYLTLLGGGAFGNNGSWIKESFLTAFQKVSSSGLDINFVSYNSSSHTVEDIIQTIHSNKIS